MGKFKDLAGMTIGKLTVLEIAYCHEKSGAYYWKCQCDCGNITCINGSKITSGWTKSCGCLQRESIVKFNYKHGMKGTRLERIYKSMKSRCYEEKNKNYYNYGGRGITVCDEWRNNSKSFYDWAMNSGYAENLEIDRRDNMSNYNPENCHWVTRKEQQRNMRSNLLIEYHGMTHCFSEWAEILNINVATLYNRLIRRGWDIEDAFTRKVGSGVRKKRKSD